MKSMIWLLALLPLIADAQIPLRQATASQAVVLGPFLDSTDAVTPETALTIDAADVRISVNGGNIAGKNSGGCTHDELGMYTCTFDATDTATVGRFQVTVAETGALVVYQEFQVLEEAVFDACCAASAAPLTAANVWAYSTRALTELDEDNTTMDLNATAVGSVSGAVASVTGNVGGNVVGSVGSVTGGINTGAGTITTLDGLDTAQDTQHGTTQTYLSTNLGANGANASAIPWNAAWDAEVQSEADDALDAWVLIEPTGVPAWGDTVAEFLAYTSAWYRNEVQQTSSTKTLRNDADDADLVTCAVSDNGTTAQVSECATAP